MSSFLVGLAAMLALTLRLRARADATAPELARSLRLLALVAALLAVLGLGDVVSLRDAEALALAPLPLVLARHLEALTAVRSPARLDVASFAAGALVLPWITLPGAQRAEVEAGGDAIPLTAHLIVAALGVWLYWLVVIAATLAGGLRLWRSLRHHRDRLAEIVAAPPGLRLQGVWLLAAFLGLAFAIQLADLAAAGTGRIFLTPALDDGFLALVILGLALHGHTLRAALPEWSREIATAPERPAYARSALDTQAQARLLARLDREMAQKALWQAPVLTLRDLAAAAGAKPFYVSQALNQGRGVSFYDYVNGWRIAEAQRLLRETDRSVIDIAFSVGFNAKSTFNAAFRKQVGMAPSAWRRSAPAGPAAEAPEA